MEAGLSIAELQLATARTFEVPTGMATCPVLKVPIGALTMTEAIRQVNRWVATASRPHLVTFVNAHMVVEAQLRPAFAHSMRAMDLNCADGAPVYWLARKQFGRRVAKIAGPEFMPEFCAQSVALGHRHFLYGGPEGVAEEAAATLRRRYPGIQIVGHYSPPFRPLTHGENEEVIAAINASEADLVWVCLGCPKQERWIAAMQDRLDAKVILAVGQAFDILAGRRRRAPAFVRNVGCEWLYRLAAEPKRLWKRYLVTNLLFVLFVLRDSLDREGAL